MTRSLITRLQASRPSYRRVRREARALYHAWSAQEQLSTADMIHPVWGETRSYFVQLVIEGVPFDFLHRGPVRHMLYRTGFGELERHELEYVLARRDRGLLDYQEPNVGEHIGDCPQLSSSVSALNKLYYVARVTDVIDHTLVAAVIDFGGGYGLSAHVFQAVFDPPPVYLIVDLPEMLALQYVFLASALGGRIVPHHGGPLEVRPGVVHLVPIHLLTEARLRCDLFL